MFSLYLLIVSALINTTSESILNDLLLDTEQFFNGLTGSLSEIYNETEKFKLLAKRSYGLSGGDGHLLGKRSLDEKTTLIRDEKGVYFIKGIENVARIPAKFPSDIQIVLGDGGDLYIVTLESLGDMPQTKLASDMVLYQLKENGSLNELWRTFVSGGYRLASYFFRDVLYVLASEHDADSKNPFEGSSLYTISLHNHQLTEKIQVLNISYPKDVKLWLHQDQMYLAVVSAESTNSEVSQTLIFKWLGGYFDFIQKIYCGDIKEITPFVIGSHMYLGVANQQDEHGNTYTDSEIFRFHLQSEKFLTYQKIKTHAASGISHFRFSDSKSKKEEHFLAVANLYERLYDDNQHYRTDSIIYKFEDDRFFPFQNFHLYGILQWLPIEGTNGEFLLLAVCLYTVVGFQYDGWRFTEVNLDFGQSTFGRDIIRMQTFEHHGNIFLTAADKSNDGTGVNLWKIKFEKENLLENHHNHLERWCKSMKMKIENENLDEKIKKLHSYLHISDYGSLGVKFRMDEAEIDTLEANSFDVYNAAMVEDLNNLNRRVKKLKSELRAMKERVEKSEFVVYFDVTDLDKIPYLELNCMTSECCSFENLNIGTLNGVEYIPFINNAVTLHENLLKSKLEFENIVITHDLALIELNGHPAATIVDTQTDLYLNSELIVNGTVILQGDLQVDERYVKDLKTEDDLLQESFQNFTGQLVLNAAKIKNLEISGKLNDIDMNKLSQNYTIPPADTYKELKVHDLYVNFPLVDLDQGVQEGDSDYENGNDRDYDILEVDEVAVESNLLSDINISDIVQTTEGKYYELDGELNFTETILVANYLQVKESFNGVSLDELESDAYTDAQDIIVEGSAIVRDILNMEGNYSVSDIIDHAVLLNATIIDQQLEFSHIQVDDVIVESINNIPVSSWVLKESKEAQVIKGKKTIVGNVYISRNMSIRELNGIQLEDMYRNTFFLDNDQTIHGNFGFSEVNSTGVRCETISLRDQEVPLKPKNIKVLGSATLDNLTVKNATVYGLVDGFSWEDIVRDSVFSRDAIITGKKTVDGALDGGNIFVVGTINSIPAEDFLKNLEEKEEEEEKEVEFEIPEDLFLNHTLITDHITFEGSLDSIHKSVFGNEWMLTEGDQTILAPMSFKTVTLEVPSILNNETINNINLKRMFRESIKLNESTHVKYLALNNMTVKNLQVLGTVNGAKFEDSVVLAKSEVLQNVEGEWFFDQDLVINGSLTVMGFVSGINITRLCSLRHLQPKDINLIVGGSVRFEQEPRILSDVNGINLDGLLKDIWLKNEDVTLGNGVKRFCCSEMEGNVNLKGHLNDLDLKYLEKNYFSKTTTKFVPETLTVKNLIVLKSCRIRDVKVGGKVNGLDLENWSKTVLLQNVDQVITGKYHFGEFSAENIVLNGTVNNLDLATDILRYDVQDAVVTEGKTFLGLTVRNLILDKGKRVQDVAVDSWARRVVKTIGNFTIEGNLTLNNAVFSKGLRTAGEVNGIIFDRDHILTTKGGQKITGQKTFDLQNYPKETLKIKHLVVNETVSGVDIDSLIKNQARKDQDLVFTGKKSFENLLTASAITVAGLFQNENITEICEGIKHQPKLEDFTDRYEDLLIKAKNLNEHFKEEPFFLDYYEVVQTLTDDIFAVLPVSSELQGRILVLTSTELTLMEWDAFADQFVPVEETLTVLNNVTFAMSGSMGLGTFFYIEVANVSKIFHSGNHTQIPVNGTSCVTSFRIVSLNKTCFFVGREWDHSQIFCYDSVINSLQTYQALDTIGTVQASTIEVDDDIYIIVINKERVLDRIENTVTIYKFDKDFKSFYVSSTLPEINPVGVSTISYQHHHFLALAGGHLPESVDSSIVTIFRLNRENDVMVRYQSLLVENPVNVHLDFLPTSELVLYVLSLNPAKPFTVFLYRGVQGFVEETSGPSLYTGERLDSFTNDAKQHFVTISGFGRGQVLRAGFKEFVVKSSRGISPNRLLIGTAAHNGYIQAENNEEDGVPNGNDINS